MTKFRTIKYHC